MKRLRKITFIPQSYVVDASETGCIGPDDLCLDRFFDKRKVKNGEGGSRESVLTEKEDIFILTKNLHKECEILGLFIAS
jgi:hypothetical protein